MGESRWAVDVAAAECQPGTYASDNGSCIPCLSVRNCVGAVTCTTATDSICSACASDYYLDGRSQCQACTPVPFCTSEVSCTNANDSTCSACAAPGYYLDDRSQCRACTPVAFCASVVSCTNVSDSTCSACAPSFYASDDGSCTPCPSPPGCAAATCTNATDSTCTECDSGYFLDTSVAPAACKPCAPVSGCVSPVTCTTASNSKCTQCAEGTWMSGFLPSTCASCSPIPGCTSAITCTNASNSTCSSCPAGYRLDAGGCVNIDECSDSTDTCSPFASCTDTLGSFECACNAGYSGDGMTCTPSCGSFRADALLWGQPLARNGQAEDTDPSAGGTIKYRYQSAGTLPVKVHALDCSSADITSKPNVSGTVHLYADLGCDGVADQELQLDRSARTGSPGTMKKADGFLAYNLDTGKFPPSPACFVLEVVVRDSTSGNEAREGTLLQRK